MTILTDAGHRLAARDHGGRGPAIVLVHGLASNLAVWDHVAAELVRDGFRVVAYDQRSHGLSDDGDHDFGYPALVSDLRAVIEAFDLGRPFVVGHSWGASVALQHALADPDCPAVVCVDGGVIDMQALGRTWEEVEDRMRPPRLQGSVDEILATIREHTQLVPWDRLEPVERRGLVQRADGSASPRLDLHDHMTIAHTLWAQRVWDVYDEISCPVMLVLAGAIKAEETDDGFTTLKRLCADRILERNPDVRVEWLESVHDIPLLHPRELSELIATFARERSG